MAALNHIQQSNSTRCMLVLFIIQDVGFELQYRDQFWRWEYADGTIQISISFHSHHWKSNFWLPWTTKNFAWSLENLVHSQLEGLIGEIMILSLNPKSKAWPVWHLAKGAL